MKTKKIIMGLLSLSLIIGQASFANENENEKAKKLAVEVYNTVVGLEGDAYTGYMYKMAYQAETLGFAENARVLREMSDADLKPELTKLMKDRIDSMSENGLGLLIWWAIAEIYNTIQYNYGPKQMKLPGQLPGLSVLIGILTLDGDEASRY